MIESRFVVRHDKQEPLTLRISSGTQREKKRLLEHIQGLQSGTIVVIDLGNEPLNSSVLDELLCKEVLWRLRDPDESLIYPVLTGLHPHTEDELRLGARASSKSNIVFIARIGDGTRLVGLPTQEVEKSFQLLAGGPMTARELADQTGLPINAAHNRLRLLHELRLAIKGGAEPARGGGRQHTYAPVQ
jgi:hypothetical protein